MPPRAPKPSARSLLALVLTLAACLPAGALAIAPGAGARRSAANAQRHRQRADVGEGRARARPRHRAGARPCRGAKVPATRAPLAEVRRAVLCLVNRQRTERGLPALRPSAALEHSAQEWTRAMVGGQFFASGTDLATRISDAGYDWRAAGENVAAGFATAREVVDGWMGSAPHCRNILDPQYANVGTGEIPSRLLGMRPSVWTQDFGLRAGRRPPSRDYAPMDGCPY